MKCYVCHCSICAIRHCPDTDIINTYFRENGYLDLAISKSDHLCTGCYNNHLDIIHENRRTSKDDELLKLMDDTSEHLPALELGEHSENIMEGVKAVIRKLGNILQQKLGILYPNLYNFFITTAIQSSTSILTTKHITDKLPKKNSLWLHHQVFWQTHSVGM